MSAQVLRGCPVCGGGEADAHIQKAELRLVRCRCCSMVYANPVPEELASGQYYDRTAADYYLSPAKLLSDYSDVRFERELRFFRQHCASGTVLDVGCSSGGFLYQLQKRFPARYEVIGTDVNGPALDYAESRGVPVIRGHFLEQQFAGKQFDALTFWAVLEHVLEPGPFLEKAWSILKPDGLCFALVPNLQSLAVRALGGRYRYIYPQHLNYFTKATLMTLAGNRFSVIARRFTHFNPVVIWQDWRQHGAEVSNQERGELLERTIGYKQNPLLKPLKVLYQLAEKTLGLFALADNLAVVLKRKA